MKKDKAYQRRQNAQGFFSTILAGNDQKQNLLKTLLGE